MNRVFPFVVCAPADPLGDRPVSGDFRADLIFWIGVNVTRTESRNDVDRFTPECRARAGDKQKQAGCFHLFWRALNFPLRVRSGGGRFLSRLMRSREYPNTGECGF